MATRLTKGGDGQYEIHPVHVIDLGGNAEMEELCDDIATCQLEHYWGVYEHQAEGGIVSVADCDTEALAAGIAKVLEGEGQGL